MTILPIQHFLIEWTIFCYLCLAIFNYCEKSLPVVLHVVLCERNLTSFFSQETMLDEKPSCHSHNRVHHRVLHLFFSKFQNFKIKFLLKNVNVKKHAYFKLFIFSKFWSTLTSSAVKRIRWLLTAFVFKEIFLAC